MQENKTPLTAAQPADKRTVWLDKYQIPVYTDLQRADEILYATDTQLLNKPKKNYFAMVDLGEPTENVAQKKLADIPLRAVTASLPGTVAGWAVGKTQFGRGLLATGVDMGRQLGAAVLKEAGSWATLAGMDTDTRLKRDGFLPGGKKETTSNTPSLAAGIFPFGTDNSQKHKGGLVDVEYVKERLGALKQEQAKIDDFNAKVKNITDNFLRRTGLAKTQEDGFLYDFGSGASSFLFSIGMLALTRNPAMVAPLFGLLEGQGSYEQAVEAGLEPEQAYLLGKSNAAWITATEMVGEGLLNKLLFTQGVLGKGAQRILKRAEGKSFKAQTLTAGILGAAQGGGIEGTQEALQNIGSDLIMNAGNAQDKNIKDILQNALYAGLLAFPLGGMAGGVGGAANFVRFTQNVKEKLVQIGIPKSKAQKLAQETALEAVSGEFVDDTLKAASGEINSPLTAERDPQAFVRQLTEAQEREIDRNAWNVGKQVEEASLKAGQDEAHAKANGTVAQALANGIYRLTKLTPTEQQHFKINILREGTSAPMANFGQTEEKGKYNFKVSSGEKAGLTQEQRKYIANEIINNMEGSLFSRFKVKEIKGSAVPGAQRVRGKMWWVDEKGKKTTEPNVSVASKYHSDPRETIKINIPNSKAVVTVHKDALAIRALFKDLGIAITPKQAYATDSLFQSAAMYKSPHKEFAAFYEVAPNNAGEKQSYYPYTTAGGVTVDVLSDTIRHDSKHPKMTVAQWEKLLGKLDNVKDFLITKPKYGEHGTDILLHLQDGYGAEITVSPKGRVLLNTAFKSTEKGLTAWIQKEKTAQMQNTFIFDFLPTTDTSRRATLPGQPSKYSLADIMREIKGNNRGTFDSANPNIYLQEDITEVDLTDQFADIAKLPADQRAQQVESSLNALIGSAMDTATPPLQIQITADNKVHIKNSNVKLKNGKLKRHQTALTTLEKIVNVAQKTDRKGAVDASHNTSKKTLAHKANVEEYLYFQAPVKIGKDTFLVELATERVKGQDKNLLDLYNVHVKRNPATAHLSTYGQGSSTDRITNNEEFVKAQANEKRANPLLQEDFAQQNATDIFQPDVQTALRFQENVKTVLADENISNKQQVEMGQLPPLYTALGLPQQDLKTNKLALRKALGLLTAQELAEHKDWHNHNVPQETIDNLPALLSDPVAVLRSNTKNGSFVAVLDSEVQGKPVVAIVSPNPRNGGYTFIPSVYERNNYETFLKTTAEKGNLLYWDKNRMSSPGALTQAAIIGNDILIDSIKTKEDVVKARANEKRANPLLQENFAQPSAAMPDDMFAVSTEVAEKFRSDVKKLLENEQIPGSQKLDMGMLPPIYVKLGLSEGELKANKMTLLKALGKAGKHKHYVPQEVLEKLPELMADPLAVFKSSAKAQNPNGYVAVLNAKNEEGKQIVAILSPKSEKYEFSFIPSVYERNKFEMFVKNTLAENGVLYIKDEAALPSLHNAVLRTNTASKSESSHLYLRGVPINRILTKEDVVKVQESGKTNNPSELLQENLFNIQQNPEGITEIHNQQTGEAIPLISHIAGREQETITPIVLNEIVANATTNKKTVRKVLLTGKTPRTLTSKLGKNYLLSTNSVDKMYSSIFEHLSGEDLRPKKEIILHLPEIFSQMDLILSHKDVRGISRDIERFAAVVRVKGQDYYVMVVGKNGRVGKVEIATLYDLQSQANKNAPTNIPGEPGHKGLIYSLGDLDKFVKRKIAKYNNNVSGKGSGTTELLQENLFNIQQNPEGITEIHNQQTGEAIPLEMNPNLKPFKPVELRSDFLPMAQNTADGKKQLIDSVFGKKEQITIKRDGKIFLLSRSSVKKMQNTSITAAKDYANKYNLQTEERRQLYHDVGEQVAQALKVFETAQLILSHKDVKNVSGRTILRYGNIFNYRGKTYYAMFVSKQDGVLSDLHLYDLQTEENKDTAGNSGVINNPSQQRYINSIDELVRFVKRKIAKYNNNISGKQKVFNQREARGSVTLNERAHEAIIRVFNQADPSTVVHELAHIYLTMINQAARVSADPEFAIFLKDLTAWLGEPGENGEYSRAQQETFARGFEGYLAEGKAPNKELEGVFAKFARWLAEVYEGVKDYLQISPEVRRVFDRLLAPEETISRSRVGDKIEAAKQLVEKIKRGQGPEIDGLTVADMKALLKTISTRKPKRPTTHLLKDLRKYGAEYGNAGQIDKEAYKNARVYDKKGGIDDRPDVWLQKMGYMDFEDTTPETLQAAYDLVQKALDGAEVYRLEDQAQAENAQAYEDNLNTVLQVFPDIKTAKETLSAIATLEQNGYRAVDKKDLTDLTQLVNVLGRMAAKLESEEIRAKEGALGAKANKIEEDAKRLKKRLMDELDKRQLENKEPMKNLLRAAKTTEDIHLAATALLDQLEKAWENTSEGKAEKALLTAPNTNWDKVRVDLLKRFNEIIGQTGEEVKAAQKVLNDLNGRILSEQQAQAKEKAEAVLKKANLEGRYVRAMEDAVRGLPHIYPADVRKKIAVLARSQQRYRLLTDKNITDFIDDVKKIQEANYKKYMSGKIGQLFSRKVYEKVGSAKRSKYSLLAKQFIEGGAQIWHLSETDLQTRYKEVIGHLDPNNAPDPWTALLNSVLALRAAPSLVPMKQFQEIYETALSAVRGDAQAKRLEILIGKTRESQLRLAAEVALKNRKLPAGTVAYLLRGGTDFQTMLSILFGKGKFDKYEKSAKNNSELSDTKENEPTGNGGKPTEPVFKGGREQYEIDFRKELSPEGEQMRAAVFDFNAKKAIFKAALDAYGLETADQVLAKMYELQNDKMQITNYGWVKDEQEGVLVDRIWQNGTAYTNNRPRVQTITREELITFWLWSQDHEIVEGKDGKAQDLGLCGRLLRAYGKDQLNAMLDKLSPQDKQYGRNLQKILADVHTMESEAHQRIYGFPLPQKENYFPSVTERITDAIDYKQQFIDNAKAPSFIKSRTISKMPVQAICSPTQLVLAHMKRASEFIFEAEKYTRLRRIFLQSDMESTFLDKFGQSDGKKLFDKLKDLIAQQGPTAAKPLGELWAMSNKLLNGWVKSALGLKVMTGVKQFASCVSFAEVMPSDKWLKYFAYGLAHPMETAQYMKAQSPYIEVRYETGGLNEAVARAMAQDELAPIKTKWNNLTNLLLLNTRMGDKASLIFGGYPYMRYLQEQGISGQEAARLFELQAVRTLQSSLKANLSMGQANGDNFAARLFMLFKNQQLQYVRRLADVYVQYKNGEVPLKQLGKTALLYLAVNPLVYVMLGIGWPSADDDDREKDFFRLASAPVTQFFDAWPFGGGVSEFLLENTCNVIRGKKLASASQAGLPMLEDFVRDINRAIKTVNQDDIPATEAVAAWLEFAKYFGVPFGTLTNMATGAKDLVTGYPVRGALKELGFSKNRAGKITGEKE